VKTIRIGNSELVSSRLAYGCMRIAGDGSREDRDKGKRAVLAAVEARYTLFDHADLYGNGACEELFAEVLRESPQLRDQILIVSKCGIRLAGDPGAEAPTRYDFSKQHIIRSVEGSLGRLGIEQLDLLLLHRPDYLMHAGEVAEAFATLESSGKVGNDQCQRLQITPQAWCPVAGVAYPAWGNTFTVEDEARLRDEFEYQSEKYAVEDWIIALAWLLKHPAMISPIIGSTTPSRIAAATSALDIDYSREDWYRLLEARNGQRVP
jgi:predicted oxidoreductase